MNDESMQSIVENFERYFEIVLATSAEQKNQVFNVRYRVYCEEFEYETVDHFPDQLEVDDYDPISQHCLIIHRESKAPAGCVRLVPALGNIDEMPLPLERYCSSSLDKESIGKLGLNRNTVCEISRLAVDGAFRRRKGEQTTRFGGIDGLIFSPQEQRTFSLIAVACFLAATAMTEIDHRTNVFAMMEPFLPRLMQRSGINFQRVGTDIDYHGIRAPYFITTQSALSTMNQDLLDLYHWIRKSLL